MQSYPDIHERTIRAFATDNDVGTTARGSNVNASASLPNIAYCDILAGSRVLATYGRTSGRRFDGREVCWWAPDAPLQRVEVKSTGGGGIFVEVKRRQASCKTYM